MLEAYSTIENSQTKESQQLLVNKKSKKVNKSVGITDLLEQFLKLDL